MGVDIFGNSNIIGKRGPPGLPGSSNLKELIKWFPELAIEQIRKNVNFSTFLVERLPPDENWDVELSSDKRVTAWRSFNHSQEGKVTLTPIGRSVVLKELLPPLNIHQRYGLKFEGQGAYYTSKILFLRNKVNTVVLTMTFSVDDVSPPAEEFILNDYHPDEKTEEHFRGISIAANDEEEEAFDLYLHGAVDNTNRLKIGTALKTSWFYTVQIKWGAQITQPNGSVRLLDSSYAIYENVDFDVKCLVEKTFQSPLISDEQTLTLSIGGKKTRSSGADGYFRGVVSNVEILQTGYETIPEELLYFVVTKQLLINDDWGPPPRAPLIL